jgi:hypothetical protein
MRNAGGWQTDTKRRAPYIIDWPSQHGRRFRGPEGSHFRRNEGLGVPTKIRDE